MGTTKSKKKSAHNHKCPVYRLGGLTAFNHSFPNRNSPKKGSSRSLDFCLYVGRQAGRYAAKVVKSRAAALATWFMHEPP